MRKIVSIGSLNMDVVHRVSSLPQPGETVQSLSRDNVAGGKGANQAVAAARAGGSVWMIGAVGRDAYGESLLEALRADGVRTDCVARVGADTGTAFITVDAEGENHIVLSAGANSELSADDIPAWIFGEASLIMLQNEIPWVVGRIVLERARMHGVPVIINAAPAMRREADWLALVTVLALNERELASLSGSPVGTSVRDAASGLIKDGAGAVLVTLGSKGSLWLGRDGDEFWTDAFAVDVVDTTAAGDTFIGAFAAEYVAGVAVEQALRFASAAAAIAVTRRGAQSSIPTREETIRFMNSTRNQLRRVHTS
ncbi:MAG: ribokinase [Pseudonocardiales bacterium]|jgi:ribokinase|nr:ribokinase [Pseudonocardiales bacterium]